MKEMKTCLSDIIPKTVPIIENSHGTLWDDKLLKITTMRKTMTWVLNFERGPKNFKGAENVRPMWGCLGTNPLQTNMPKPDNNNYAVVSKNS